jgi:hypothetical protein
MRSGSNIEAKKHIEKKKTERDHIKNDILKESRFVGIPKPFCFIHNRKKIVLSDGSIKSDATSSLSDSKFSTADSCSDGLNSSQSEKFNSFIKSSS